MDKTSSWLGKLPGPVEEYTMDRGRGFGGDGLVAVPLRGELFCVLSYFGDVGFHAH